MINYSSLTDAEFISANAHEATTDLEKALFERLERAVDTVADLSEEIRAYEEGPNNE